MKRILSPSTIALLVALAFLATASFAVAQEEPANEPEPAPTESAKDAKQREKEERVQEYLRKKEERRARKEHSRSEYQEKEAASNMDAQTERLASGPVTTPKKKKKTTRVAAPPPAKLPRNIARLQAMLRESPLSSDPTVGAYLDLIDSQDASPQQLAAFANFLGQAGMQQAAIEYYGIALRIEPENSLLWINVGTLHRQLGELNIAASAYGRALNIEPSNALGHYNLGAVLDQMEKYEDAIQEYTLALKLDPTLGDPAYNPQAANNERLLAVKLMLYQEQSGSLGLPLMDVPGGSATGSDSRR
ncbi:MAG: tetratricopeptide repeat protein [bacterium]|nr:tetratricopeptide repeat protein [bacterium]